MPDSPVKPDRGTRPRFAEWDDVIEYLEKVEDERDRLRKALETIAYSTEHPYGPKPEDYAIVAQKALATDDERRPTPEQVERVKEIHQAQRAVRGPEPPPASPSSHPRDQEDR